MAEGITYYELTPSDFEGMGWRDEARESPFNRVPLCLKGVPGVFGNGHTPIGLCAFFNTDSTRYWVKMELLGSKLGEPNFNVCAFSGTDLYMFDDEEDRWRWAGTYTDSQCIQDNHPEYAMLEGIEKKPRRCRLYLPMRNWPLKIFIGVEDGASFEKVAPRESNKLVYYGTSIIHGAYSTRSGLGIAQMLGRNLDMPLLNLGFSGACHLETEVGEMLVKLQDVRLLVVDPMHNMGVSMIQENMGRFLDIVCPGLPETDIVVVSAPEHLQSWLKPGLAASQRAAQRLMEEIVREKQSLYPKLHFIDGRDFYGSDEVSPDGIHPNDTAAMNMVKILTVELKKILAHGEEA